MKTLLKKKFKRTLAMLFAVAMTVTSIPQTAYAAEVNDVESTEVKETIAADGGVSGNSWEVTFVNDGNVTISGNDPTATEGTDYTFKAVANEGYGNVSVAAYTTASYETDAKSAVEVNGPAEDVYTIAGTAITEAITVVVSATVQVPQTTYYKVTKSADEDAKIVYVENCVEETEGQPDQIVEGKKLEFIVNIEDQAKEIDTISCTVGGEEVTVHTQEIQDGSVIYSIAAEDITGDVVISVTLKYKGSAQPTAYTVTTVAEGVTVTYVDDCVAEGKITAGADLKFTVSANDTAKEVETVKYSMGDVADEALEADADGVYTVASVSDNVIITATLKDKEAPAPEAKVYTVTFETAEGASVTDLQVNGETVEAADGVLSSVSVNDVVTFKVATEETHELIAVKAGETPVEAVEGVYSVTVTEDVVICIETKVYNKVTFAVAGDAASYTATVSGNDAVYEIGDILYTNEETVSVSLNEATGYQIDKVELGKEEQKKADGTPLTAFPVTFTEEVKDYTVKVTTSPVASEENATVVFANASDYMTYAVTTNEKVVKVAGKSNTYDVFAGADYVKFTVTATGNYQPIVKLDGEELPFEKEKTKNGKTPYTFKVRANALNIEELNVITIEHELEDKMVTVSFAEDEVTLVSANVNGVKAEVNVSEPVDGVVTASFAVPYGSTIKVTAEAKENCKMTKAVTTVGTKTKDEKIKNNAVTFSVKATDDADTVITSEKTYAVIVTTATGEEINPVKGVYNVQWAKFGSAAKIGIRYGEKFSNMQVFKETALRDSKNTEIESRVIINSTFGNTANLIIAESDAGKTLIATVTIENGKSFNIKFKVAPLATKVTVAGVENGVLTQTADTTKEYTLTYDKNGVPDTYVAEVVSVSENGVVSVSENAPITAEIVNGKLRVTTLGVVCEKIAKIKIYNAEAFQREDEKVYLEGGEFDVTIAEPAMMNVKSSVKLKSSDDVSLTLTLGAKKVDTPNVGKVYYKVEVTSAETDANIVNAIAKPFYIEKNGASQDAKIVVNNSAFGSGKAAKYNVKVTLVQTKDSEELTAENTEGKDVFTSNKYATKSNLKTKAAYYETNLKLKKGTTTVYTGQSNIVVATAKFGNKTTHTELMRAYSTTNGVNSSLDATKQKVLVEVASDVKPGKYTITVEAKAPENTIPSKTSITINVVKGIQTIDVDMPCASVYKQDKKAVSVTAKAVFNKYQNYVPKSKKVTWSIVDKEGNELTHEDSLYGKISVKNGKVTVAKNYIVSNVETDNQFRVRATAADWKGNTVFGLSEVITITSATVELGEVILVDEVYDEIHWISQDIFNVVGRSGETVTADQILHSRVVVLKKGSVEKDSYTREELEQFSVPSENVTFSVSNKAVKLDSEGYIETIDKPVKNVNITAKIMDGSNKKAVLSKLTINYSQVNDLSLKVYPTTPKEDDPTTLLYSADLPEILSVELFDRTEEGSYEILEHGQPVNFDFEIIEGANLVYLDKRNKSIAFLPTAKETKVKLVDKTKKGESAVKIYTLLNESWQETAAPKITVSGNDYLYAGYYPAKQTMTFKIDGTYSGNAVKVGIVDSSEEEWDFGYQLKVTGGGNVFDIAPDGTFTLEWERWADNYTELVKGNYKIYVAFGNATRETTSYGYEWVKFTAETAPTVVTVKVKDPTITESVFHLDTSYKIYLRDGLSAQLTGTGKGVNMDTLYFNKVENINVNGQANKFADYFVLGDDHRSIKLRDNVNVDDITENDLKGYLSYNIAGDSMLNTGCSGTVQIKITLDKTKTTQKYALSDLTVSGNEASDNMVAPYSVSGNAFVYVNDNTDNMAEVSEVYCESEDFMVYVDNTRTLHFKNIKELEFGSYEVEAYVVTNANLYDYKIYLLKQDYVNEQDEVRKAELKADYEKAIQTYGVKVKTTITIEKAE